MQPDKLNNQDESKQLSQQNSKADKTTDENVAAAHDQAETDIEQDVDLNNAPDPATDLDEGELAQLDNENDDNPLI